MFKKEKADTYKFKTGDRITHVKYGTGTILGCFTFHPPNNLYRVDFDNGWCTSEVPEDDLSEFSFKIGDRVTVASMRYGSYGKTGTIVRDARYQSIFDFVVYFDGSGAGAYVKEDLKLCKEEKQMTKSDLKTGMMVKLKNGEKYIALMNSIEGSVLVNKDGWLALSNYNNDLTHTDYISCDIESAYTPRAVPYIFNMSEQLFSQHWEQHWERCFVKDVTMRDIEKKFGCKVKIVNEI